MEQIKTAVWDLDGTKINSFGIFNEVLADVLPAHGIPMPSEQIMRENYHGTLRDSIGSALGLSEDTLLDQIVQQFLATQDQHYDAVDHHFYPDALRLAERLYAKDVYQVVVTNRDHKGRMQASPRSIIERSILSTMIDRVICGDDSEHRKPNPEVVRDMIDGGLLVPEETVVIGDQFVDAQFARNLGAQAIIVCREGEPVHMDRLGPDWQQNVTIVSSLDEAL